MKAASQFFRLPAADQKLLWRTFVLVLFIRLWLWVAPYRPLHRALLYLAEKRGGPSRISRWYPERAAWAVRACSRRIPGARHCLVEALALEFILKRRRFPAELRLGVCHDGQGRLRAHAWIECAGRIVIGNTDLAQYSMLHSSQSGPL